ncbi:hypothetical protein AJ80_04456 [Polytolypa hystricis UAMH7299]|uniref:Uncharacterized protein n=1 Tax=Polytolypa hystricis (strain UAMH7299) TaxID=1447883 RepID=A0A2B7YAD1_POLH7|nr:hypothetical protein AJ80_04456 [Polytolypa hystricis UAMH7299]
MGMDWMEDASGREMCLGRYGQTLKGRAYSEKFDAQVHPGNVPMMGQGLFANETVLPGRDLLVIPANFSVVLDTERLADTCAYCFGQKSYQAEARGEEPKMLKACTGCNTVRYCDKECQSKSWRFIHKHECKIFKQVYPNILASNARAALQLILLLPTSKIASDDKDMFQTLTGIRSHHLRDEEFMKRSYSTATALQEITGTKIPIDDIVEFLGKLAINSFTLTSPFYDQLGICLIPWAALFNHNCDPNAVAGFDGGYFYVKALKPIQLEEQVFISYIDNTEPIALRAGALWKRYGFGCLCEKCLTKSGELHDDIFLSPEIETIRKLERDAHEALKTAKASKDPKVAAKSLRSAMDVLEESIVWPIMRQPYLQMRDELIVYLLEAKHYQTAFIEAAIRHLRTDPVLFTQEWHPIRNLHIWTLAKLAIHISQGIETPVTEWVDLQEYNLNLALIIYSLLSDLNKSCWGMPTARATYFAKFQEVKGEFVANGFDPESMQEEIDEEWRKMEVMVAKAVQISREKAVIADSG